MISYKDFSTAWHGVGATSHPGRAYRKITNKYSESHRHYHTGEHISDCLAKIPMILSAWHYPHNGKPLPEVLPRDIHELAMILIGHDFYYDVLAKDNEEQSARAIDAMLLAGGVNTLHRHRIYDGILATKPRVTPRGGLARTASDIDISILGASEERFDRYDLVDIPLEYPLEVVADIINLPITTEADKRRVQVAYCVGRSGILQGYLDRPSIFLTDFFMELYERQARKNLTRSIARLLARKTELEK